MPSTKTISGLYDLVELVIPVPSTVEEFDNQVGEAGACLEEGIYNIVYRNTLNRIYKASSETIAATHPKVQAVKDGVPQTTKLKEGTRPVMESDLVHLERVWTEGVKNPDGSENAEETKALQTKISEALQSAAKTQPFYKEGQGGGGGGGKISAANLAAANRWLAQNDPNLILSKVEIIESRAPGYKITPQEDGTYTAEALARGIAAMNKQLTIEVAKMQKGLLG